MRTAYTKNGVHPVIEVKRPTAGSVIWFVAWGVILVFQMLPKLSLVFRFEWQYPLVPLGGLVVLLALCLVGREGEHVPSSGTRRIFVGASLAGVALCWGYALFLLRCFEQILTGQNGPKDFLTVYLFSDVFLGVFTAIWLLGTLRFRFGKGKVAAVHFLFPTAIVGFSCLFCFTDRLNFEEWQADIGFMRNALFAELMPLTAVGLLAAAFGWWR